MAQLRASQVVLITGCGSGVGYELAQQLSETGDYIVVATTRANSYIKMQKQFQDLPQFNKTLFTKCMDVTKSEEIDSVVSQTQKHFGGIDILINNAAVCMVSAVEDFSSNLFEQIMQVNFYGALNLCRRVLPNMRKRRRGRIINISSVSGFMSLPSLGLYSVSKFALEAFSQALATEVEASGVSVQVVQPGLINNQAYKKMLVPMRVRTSLLDAESPNHDVYYFMNRLMNYYRSRWAPTSRQVARRIVSVIEASHRRFNNRVTFDCKALHFCKYFVPKFVKKLVVKGLMASGVAKWLPTEAVPAGGNSRLGLSNQFKLTPS